MSDKNSEFEQTPESESRASATPESERTEFERTESRATEAQATPPPLVEPAAPVQPTGPLPTGSSASGAHSTGSHARIEDDSTGSPVAAAASAAPSSDSSSNDHSDDSAGEYVPGQYSTPASTPAAGEYVRTVSQAEIDDAERATAPAGTAPSTAATPVIVPGPRPVPVVTPTDDPYVQTVNLDGSADRASATSAPSTAVEPTTAVEPPYTPEPATAVESTSTPEPAYAPATPTGPRVVYVETPEPPKKKGNRGVGALIALLSSVVFGVLFVGVFYVIFYLTTGRSYLGFVSSLSFYLPVLFFAVGFVLLVLILNRARWGAYVFGSIFVGLFVYFGTIATVLLLNGVLSGTAAQASADFYEALANPTVIAAGLLAREVSLWMGAAISARGRRIKARNVEAQEAFERDAAQQKADYERSTTSGTATV